MKDVKFKVWDKILHSWSKNTHRFLHNEGVLTLDSGDRYDFVQWTGLLDRHGDEIYEGDIVRFLASGVRDSVTFGDCGFWLSDIPMSELCIGRNVTDEIEIIGSVHENPELLK